MCVWPWVLNGLPSNDSMCRYSWECHTWVLLACANPGSNCDKSLLLPSPQKEQVIQHLLRQICLEGQLNRNMKVSIGRWTRWLWWCLPPCLLPSLPPCLPAPPGLHIRKFQWNIAAVESPAQSERVGDVTSRRQVRSNFTGSSESGWSLWTELCV